MSTTTSLEQIRIASPCTARWEDMMPVGDGQKARHCGQCGLNVHDLSAMTPEEAAGLVGRAQGRMCVRLYRRADGRVITKDCPVGLRAARERVARMVGRAAAAVALVFSARTLVPRRDGAGMRLVHLQPMAIIRDWLAPAPPIAWPAASAGVEMGDVCFSPSIDEDGSEGPTP